MDTLEACFFFYFFWLSVSRFPCFYCFMCECAPRWPSLGQSRPASLGVYEGHGWLRHHDRRLFLYRTRAYLLTPSLSLSLHLTAHTDHHHFSFLFFFLTQSATVYLRLNSHGILCRFRVKSGRVDVRTAAWLCTLCNISIPSTLCSCTFITREKRFNKRCFLGAVQNKSYVMTSFTSIL